MKRFLFHSGQTHTKLTKLRRHCLSEAEFQVSSIHQDNQSTFGGRGTYFLWFWHLSGRTQGSHHPMEELPSECGMVSHTISFVWLRMEAWAMKEEKANTAVSKWADKFWKMQNMSFFRWTRGAFKGPTQRENFCPLLYCISNSLERTAWKMMEFCTIVSCLFQDKGAAWEKIGWSLNGKRAKGAAKEKLIGHTQEFRVASSS